MHTIRLVDDSTKKFADNKWPQEKGEKKRSQTMIHKTLRRKLNSSHVTFNINIKNHTKGTVKPALVTTSIKQ